MSRAGHIENLAFAQHSDRAYAIIEDGVYQFDIDSYRFEHLLDVDGGMSEIAVTADGGKVYIGVGGTLDQPAFTLRGIDVDHRQSHSPLPSTAYVLRLLMDQSRDILYVVGLMLASSRTEEQGRIPAVAAIDTASDTVIATIPIGVAPGSAAIDPARARLYVGSRAGIHIIDTATLQHIGTISLDVGMQQLAVAPDGGAIFAADYEHGVVSVIVVEPRSLVATIPVDARPVSLAVMP